MIRGERVLLRPITGDDLPRLRAWQSDPAIMTGWGIPEPLVPSGEFVTDLAGRFATFAESGYLIIESPDGPIGRIDFERLDIRHGSCAVAMYIGEVAAQGQGYASDALSALARYLFNQRCVRRIELTVIASNQRAIRLYERIGFVTEGRVRDHVFFDGAYHDEVVMALHPDSRQSPGNDPPIA